MKSLITASRPKLGLILTLLSISISGCSKRPTEASNAVSAGENVEGASALTLYSWDEYFSLDLLKEFEAKFGVSVNYQKYENTDEVFQNLKSDGAAYDVIVLDDASMKRAKALRLLRPLDHGKVPNVKNIDPGFRAGATYDKEFRYSVPYMWGTTLIAYRKDVVNDISESWKVLFSPQFQGKVSLLDERMECFAAALRVLGYDMNSNVPSELDAATEMLIDLVGEGKAKLGSDNEMKRHLIDGESHIAMMYSGDAALIAEDSEDIGFFIPEEGATRWTDSFAISRDSRSVDLAHEFINFMADARIAAESSNELWYATPNLAALNHPALNAELKADTTIYPEDVVVQKCTFLEEVDDYRVRSLNKGWDRVKSEVSVSSSVSDEIGSNVVDAGDVDGE